MSGVAVWPSTRPHSSCRAEGMLLHHRARVFETPSVQGGIAMSRLQFVVVLTLGCLVGQLARAGDAPPAAPNPCQETGAFDRVRQLLQAAEHLRAAGAFDLMRQTQAQAEELLAREASRLAREQEQLQELSRNLNPTQIIVQALIIEASGLPEDLLARLVRQRGGELVRPDSAADGAPSAVILAEGATGAEEVRTLTGIADLEILSRPQVMTLDGTLAQIQIGQVVPVVSGFRISESGSPVPTHTNEDVGISLSITPTTVSDGRIRLELLVEQTRLSETGIPLYTDPESGEAVTSPVKDVRTVQTTYTVPEGRTLFFPVSHIEDAASEESALLLLLQPRVVKRSE